jgi:hypothetical protein
VSFRTAPSAIAWLEALPSTPLPDVAATQSARTIEELAQSASTCRSQVHEFAVGELGRKKIMALLVGEHQFVTWPNQKPFSILGITGLQWCACNRRNVCAIVDKPITWEFQAALDPRGNKRKIDITTEFVGNEIANCACPEP